MKDEYIIISKTAIQKRIEELEKDLIHSEWKHNIKTHNGHSPQQRERKNKVDLELNTLKEILSQSTPLIPEIEKAFGLGAANNANGKPLLSEYISNLKLNI